MRHRHIDLLYDLELYFGLVHILCEFLIHAHRHLHGRVADVGCKCVHAQLVKDLLFILSVQAAPERPRLDHQAVVEQRLPPQVERTKAECQGLVVESRYLSRGRTS